MKQLIIKHLYLFIFAGCCLLACKNDTPPAANAAGSLRGQKPSTRFEQEILDFEAADKKQFPPKNAILFTGSSSIRMWKTLEKDMAPLPVINRGFGGSTIPEVIQYADRIIFPYEPQIIVLYCGENDIHEKTLPEIVVQNFKRFVQIVHEKLPETQIVYLSMKPSPARWDEWNKFEVGNLMIQKFAQAHDKVHFLNITRPMLIKGNGPDPHIFLDDSLHMNQHGYVRWTALLKPYLQKLYRPTTQNTDLQ
ncbi:MAG: hypothetical protein D6714_19200 [Bacteroidetes bacterium]|nr:MAG: hypothetical protein D6714_19200 [Bacteroidota bacterium]